jgi:hypothetical protein
MVLFQFPMGSVATRDLLNVDTDTGVLRDFPQRGDPDAADPDILVDHPRIQQGVWHQWANRKVHIKLLNLVYITSTGALKPPPDLYRMDFWNLQMIGNAIVAQGNGVQGTHCSHGIVFSNGTAQYGLGGNYYEFDAWLQGPLLIVDILPHDVEPRDFCPLNISDGFAHGHVTLDVTLLE